MFLIFYCENFGTLKIEIGQQMRKLEIWPPKRPRPHIPHRWPLIKKFMKKDVFRFLFWTFWHPKRNIQSVNKKVSICGLILASMGPRICQFSALRKKMPKTRLILFDSLCSGIFYIKNTGKSKLSFLRYSRLKIRGQKTGLKKFRYPIHVNDDIFRPPNYEQNGV